MLAERYKLVVEGIEDGADTEAVKVAVSERFNLPIAQVNRLFAQQQVTLRDDLDKERAWHVQRLLEDMSVRAKVIPMPLSNLKLSELEMEQPAAKGFTGASSVADLNTARQIKAQPGQRTTKATLPATGNGAVKVESGSAKWQVRPMPIAPAQTVTAMPYRSRRTAVKAAQAAPTSSWKLSSILLIAGAVVATAYLAKVVLPMLS